MLSVKRNHIASHHSQLLNSTLTYNNVAGPVKPSDIFQGGGSRAERKRGPTRAAWILALQDDTHQ